MSKPASECHNTYHRAAPDLISGRQPETENCTHIGCDFHPDCQSLRFVNCVFIECEGAERLRNDGGMRL